MSLPQLLNDLRTRWRRWRLLRAYSKVFQVKTGKSVGFTPLMAAYDRAEQDGVLELQDGEVVGTGRTRSKQHQSARIEPTPANPELTRSCVRQPPTSPRGGRANHIFQTVG